MADEFAGIQFTAVLECTHRQPGSLVSSSTILRIPTTTGTEFVDLTDTAVRLTADSQVVDGMLWLFCLHTSCGLVLIESETGFKEDLAGVLGAIAPPDRYWAHNDLNRRWENLVEGERPNGHSHVRTTLATHPCLTLPILDGQLVLGRWQRTFLLELDGGRERQVVAQVWNGDPVRAAGGGDGGVGR